MVFKPKATPEPTQNIQYANLPVSFGIFALQTIWFSLYLHEFGSEFRIIFGIFSLYTPFTSHVRNTHALLSALLGRKIPATIHAYIYIWLQKDY